MSKKYLVVVEAPNKVKKVSEYFNKADPKNEYVVQASVGHIMDLDPECMSIDFDTFTPQYVISKDKKDVVKKLQSEYKNCDDVLLASDSDAEGCAIAWSVAHVLKLKNPRRVLYQEISEKAIKEALKNPVPIDMDLFHNQQARRMLDRIIGYDVSPVVQEVLKGAKSAGRVQSVTVRLICEKEEEIEKFFDQEQSSYFKTTSEFNKTYRAILYTSKEQEKIDDEEENDKNDNNDKKKKKKAKTTKTSKKGKKKDSDDSEDEEENDSEEEKKDEKKSSKLQPARVIGEAEMKKILNDINKSTFKVSDIYDKESKRSPPKPYTTDSLIQDAHRKLGFSTQRTTSAAQNLYAAGYITYIRTDSPNISESALEEIGKMVISEYGKKYHRQQQYKAKAANAQCAHECIRPIHIENKVINAKEKCGHDEMMLYKMIWRRTMASQMEQAIFQINTVEIDISKLEEYKFICEQETCTFDGFLAVYNPEKNEDEEDEENNEGDKKDKKIKLPKKGDKMEIGDVLSTQEYKKPPARYDDGSIIGKMKKIGIGRPSTYNSIIKKIQEAKYIELMNNSGVEKKSITLKLVNGKIIEEEKTIVLGKDTKKCVPTKTGRLVNKFLIENFPEIMDYKFTAGMEKLLDKISEGKMSHVKMLSDFYKDFKPLVDDLKSKAKTGELSLNGTKELGIHPTLGYKIVTSEATYGNVVKLINDKNKVVNIAPIKGKFTPENITVADAVELFKFPRELGKHERVNVSLCNGHKGYYLKYSGNYLDIDINKEEAEKFTLEDAIEKIEEKNKKAEEKKKNLLWSGKDKAYNYSVIKAKYNECILAQPIKKSAKAKGTFYSLPKNTDINSLTVEKVCEIIKNSRQNKFKKKDKEEQNNKDNKKDDKDDKKTDKADKTVKKIEKADKPDKTVKKIEKDDKKPKPKAKALPKKSKKEVNEELDDIFELSKKKTAKKNK
jgi:DNA topoisomerase-1